MELKVTQDTLNLKCILARRGLNQILIIEKIFGTLNKNKLYYGSV